jgi:DNA-binding MltR family transcriptional regulator
MIKDHREKIDEVMAFRRTLSPESDRGCALIAAAYLDAELEKLLRLAVVDDPKVADNLFDQSRPLGTFSSRIDLAYLLGLIGISIHRDLHLIRKIRNDFGHDHSPITFETQRIKCRCKELFTHPLDTDFPPRRIFMAAAMGVLASIHTGLTNKERNSERAGESLPDKIGYNSQQLEKMVLDALVEHGDDPDTSLSHILKALFPRLSENGT